MKTKTLLYALFISGGIIISSFILYPTGSPGGKTGSPGDGGANCTGCHSGTAQQISGWITSNIPGSGYIAGQTYTITANATHSGAALYGFEVTAEDVSGAKTGTIVITDAAQTKKVNSNKAITHTASGTSPSGGSKTWSFDWTAPASGTGTVKFYGAFNAANGDGNNTGDVIYTSTLTVSEATTGITDNLAASVDIKVYPNPFADYIEIAYGNLEKPIKSIRLSGQDGRMIIVKGIENGNQDKYRIDASGFSKGIYFITVVFSDFRQAAYKVVKN